MDKSKKIDKNLCEPHHGFNKTEQKFCKRSCDYYTFEVPQENTFNTFDTYNQNKKFKYSKYNFLWKTFLCMIASITLCAIFVIAILHVVWGLYFSNYDDINSKVYSDVITQDIQEKYNENHDLKVFNEDYLAQNTMFVGSVIACIYDNEANLISTSYRGPISVNEEIDKLKKNNVNVKELSKNIYDDDNSVVGQVVTYQYGNSSLSQKVDSFVIKDYAIVILVCFIVAFILTCIIAFFWIRSITRPVRRIMEVADRIKKGERNVRIGKVKDSDFREIAQTFDEALDSLAIYKDNEKRLTYDIAHELKTPLTSIRLNIDSILDGVNEPDHKTLSVMSLEVKRLSRLVEALLNLSRLENKKVNIKKTDVDISNVADGIYKLHQPLFEASNILFEKDIQPSLIVNGDIDMITQIITNIVSNAFRYTDDGGNVLISVNEVDNFAQISVCDTGIGMSSEEIKRVFTRFWRADKARTMESVGLGVGLSIVQEMVNIHEGYITVKSKQGRGSCFIISIPLKNK